MVKAVVWGDSASSGEGTAPVDLSRGPLDCLGGGNLIFLDQFVSARVAGREHPGTYDSGARHLPRRVLTTGRSPYAGLGANSVSAISGSAGRKGRTGHRYQRDSPERDRCKYAGGQRSASKGDAGRHSARARSI